MIDQFGFCRVAAIVPELCLANVDANISCLVEDVRTAVEAGAGVVLTPELSVCGYSCGDLFFQESLLTQCQEGLATFLYATQTMPALVVIGLPLRWRDRLYNCAAVCCQGEILGVIPKRFLPHRGEFYETRWFTPASTEDNHVITLCGQAVPFGSDLLFKVAGDKPFTIGLEICEDLWAVIPPSSTQALAGAILFLNPSASPELLGKAEYRRSLVAQQSARTLSAYMYASAGTGESSADLLYGGHALIAENGQFLAESSRFSLEKQMVLADIDIAFLQHERRMNSSFTQDFTARKFREIVFSLSPITEPCNSLCHSLSATPFVPETLQKRASHCEEIFSIQSTALARRIRHTGLKRVVVGLSGGLDSSLALLVCLRAFGRLGLPTQGILAVTMPGFGTTGRTFHNAKRLAELLLVELREISIVEAVNVHFRDIQQPVELHDVTYENAQARERTQILMDIANREGGIVVGTGDLSEAALGWCTFNGDHMSMYHVNAGVPKTLVRYVISWCAEEFYKGEIAEVLQDICETPITPELLPLAQDGTLAQETEAVVGPYELHDFFLYHAIRRGAPPEKVRFLAGKAFAGKFDTKTISHWSQLFYQRFFNSQFKRNVMPDGPKVGSVALSPRGDWRMPSDASAAGWLGK